MTWIRAFRLPFSTPPVRMPLPYVGDAVLSPLRESEELCVNAAVEQTEHVWHHLSEHDRLPIDRT